MDVHDKVELLRLCQFPIFMAIRLNLLTAISSTYRVESLCSEEPAVSGPDPPGHQGGGEREDQREQQQRRPHHGQAECLSVSESL